MRNFRLTPLGSRITSISLAIGIGTSAIVYIWVVPIGGHTEASRPIFIGALISLLLSGGFGFYFAYLTTARIRRIDEAAREVAEGNFAARIPIEHSGQLGQLARTFNEMQGRLAELDTARKQFIANASHELRTPIFSLGGFLELLEDEEPNPDERAEFLRTMRQQIERLTKLTSDLLNLSQLDAGGVELDPRDVDLSALAREVVREFGPRADRRGSRLELRTPERPVTAFADPERVRQIIRILLDNALTHTPEGVSVTVTTYSVNRRAELTVSDDGGGIPQRVQKRLFERFYTANPQGGSGLGLAIAREVAQRMQGGMAVSSSRRFTAFTLDLPMGRRAARPASTTARVNV
jgi:two-component system, OmpR family, sensor kinase